MNNGVFRARQLPNCFQGQPNAANFLGGAKGLLDGQLNIASFYRAETAKKGLATSAHWRRCAETNFDNAMHTIVSEKMTVAYRCALYTHKVHRRMQSRQSRMPG
jgi:hypothetical protein